MGLSIAECNMFFGIVTVIALMVVLLVAIINQS